MPGLDCQILPGSGRGIDSVVSGTPISTDELLESRARRNILLLLQNNERVGSKADHQQGDMSSGVLPFPVVVGRWMVVVDQWSLSVVTWPPAAPVLSSLCLFPPAVLG